MYVCVLLLLLLLLYTPLTNLLILLFILVLLHNYKVDEDIFLKAVEQAEARSRCLHAQ